MKEAIELVETYKERRRLAIFDAAVQLMAADIIKSASSVKTLNVGVYIAQAVEILEAIEEQEEGHEDR